MRTTRPRAVPELPECLAAVVGAFRCRGGRFVRVRPRRDSCTVGSQSQVPTVPASRKDAGAIHGATCPPRCSPPRAVATGDWPEGVVRDRSCGRPGWGVGQAHGPTSAEGRGRTFVVAAPSWETAPRSHGCCVPAPGRPWEPPRTDRRRAHIRGNRSERSRRDRKARYLHPDCHLSRYYVKQEHDRSRTLGGGVAEKRLSISLPVVRCAKEHRSDPMVEPSSALLCVRLRPREEDG